MLCCTAGTLQRVSARFLAHTVELYCVYIYIKSGLSFQCTSLMAIFNKSLTLMELIFKKVFCSHMICNSQHAGQMPVPVMEWDLQNICNAVFWTIPQCVTLNCVCVVSVCCLVCKGNPHITDCRSEARSCKFKLIFFP